MNDFKTAKGLKARLLQTQEILKALGDFKDPKAVATQVLEMLNTEIGTHHKTLPALALEAIFVRDEVYKAAEIKPDDSVLTAEAVWSLNPSLQEVIDPMPTARHKQALHSFRDCNKKDWDQKLLESINSASTKLCGEAADVLIEEGRLPEIKELVVRLISQHNASSELLLWLAKERTDAFADILGPEVFRAMLSAIERDQFNEKKSNRLRDFILDDKALLVELIESADIEVIKDLTRTLQLSPSFDDMDKRSLLARIVKHFPVIQSLISGEQHAHQDNSLVVSWASLERRKDEYSDLVHKRIPANSKEIAVARSYGDLRENHEYKAAKEMQKILMRNKAELENQLGRSRGTDFANPRTDVVSIGTRVRVTDLNTSNKENYVILGAWDFDAEKSIISYLTPLAQGLLNHKPGDEVEFELEGATKRYRVESIEAYNAGGLTAPATQAQVQPQA